MKYKDHLLFHCLTLGDSKGTEASCYDTKCDALHWGIETGRDYKFILSLGDAASLTFISKWGLK